jgi:DME family drug/metabolite transporter
VVRSGWRPFRLAAGWPLVVASGALAVFQWSFFAAVQGAGSAAAAVVSAGVSPFAGDALAAARIRGRLSSAYGAGVLLMAALTALPLVPELDPMLAGMAAAVVSGIAYAVYAEIASQRTRDVPAGPAPAYADVSLALTALALLGAAVSLAPVAVAGAETLASLHGLTTVAYLGLIATALPYAAFVRGLRRLSAGDALALLALQPLAAAAIGWFALDERLDAPAAFATIALLGATTFRSWRPSAVSRTTESNQAQEEAS